MSKRFVFHVYNKEAACNIYETGELVFLNQVKFERTTWKNGKLRALLDILQVVKLVSIKDELVFVEAGRDVFVAWHKLQFWKALLHLNFCTLFLTVPLNIA